MSCSSCSRFTVCVVPTSNQRRCLRGTCFAKSGDDSLFFLPLSWCHLYSAGCAKILYAITEPNFGEKRLVLLHGRRDKSELTLEGRGHAEAEVMHLLLRLASRRAGLYIARKVERIELYVLSCDWSMSCAGRMHGTCCVGNCTTCADGQ